jgi:restriction endonuclease Mrr
LTDDPVYAEFSLEAKCYRPSLEEMTANRVGVKEVARLISRIRHRQFGVLVTTSVVHKQAYQEAREDRHPIIFISGRDIADILIRAGFNTPQSVETFLKAEFPTEVDDE